MLFSTIVIHRREGHDPRCRYYNRMTIRPYRLHYRSTRPYHRRAVRRRRKITSPEQDRRCCQRETYCDLFHGFISSIEQVRSPSSPISLSQAGRAPFRTRLVCTHRFVDRCAVTDWFTGRLALFLFLFLFLFLHLHFYLYRRRTLVTVSIRALLIMIRRDVATAENGSRDCQGKEGAEFFHDFFYLFFWMAENKSILSLAESISVTCCTHFARIFFFALWLPETEMRISSLSTDV